MRSIYLIGFMGAGKTEVGKILSEKLKRPVIDMDEEIVRTEKMEITEIFSLYGEEYFRTCESQILRKLQNEHAVVTTGGGVILKEENRNILKENTYTIFLKCDPSVIQGRLQGDTTRPLLKQKSFAEITAMYEGRLPLYNQCATLTIDTSELSIEEVVDQIIVSIDK